MPEWIQFDERTDEVAGRVAFIFLALTHAALLTAILFQRYIQGLPPGYYNDLAIIFAGSLLGYWFFSFFLGGVMPVLSIRSIVSTYALFVLGIGLPYTLIRGLPQDGEWSYRLLIILGAPAVLVGGYALVAAMGKRRLDRLTDA